MSNQPDIKALFHKYNAEHFGGIIPSDTPVVWNTRLRTTAGRCHYKRNWATGQYEVLKIELSYRLFEKNGWNMEEIERTLIHEMVHAWQAVKNQRRCGHDREFQWKMDQIFGYRKSHRCHNYDTKGLKEERQIEAHCPIHGVVYRWARMPRRKRMSCRQCGSPIEVVDTRKPTGGIRIKVRL